MNAKKRTLFRLRGSGRISGLRTTKAFRRLCFQLAFQVSLNLQINAGAITVSSFRTIRFKLWRLSTCLVFTAIFMERKSKVIIKFLQIAGILQKHTNLTLHTSQITATVGRYPTVQLHSPTSNRTAPTTTDWWAPTTAPPSTGTTSSPTTLDSTLTLTILARTWDYLGVSDHLNFKIRSKCSNYDSNSLQLQAVLNGYLTYFIAYSII